MPDQNAAAPKTLNIVSLVREQAASLCMLMSVKRLGDVSPSGQKLDAFIKEAPDKPILIDERDMTIAMLGLDLVIKPIDEVRVTRIAADSATWQIGSQLIEAVISRFYDAGTPVDPREWTRNKALRRTCVEGLWVLFDELMGAVRDSAANENALTVDKETDERRGFLPHVLETAHHSAMGIEVTPVLSFEAQVIAIEELGLLRPELIGYAMVTLTRLGSRQDYSFNNFRTIAKLVREAYAY